jgi:hypothetical protein
MSVQRFPVPVALDRATADADFAPIAAGVTNGNSHDHSGGDGAQVAYGSLSGLPTLGTAAAQSAAAFEAAGAVSTHAADATDVHGIADTSALLTTSAIGSTVQGFDAQLSSLAALGYAGNALKVVRINAGETGFELTALSAGSGDVVGPASAVNNRVAFFDGTTGKLLKDSGLTLSGSNTGDQDLSSYATTAAVAAGYQPLDAQLTSIAGISYGGNALKLVRVNAGETGFELVAAGGGSGDVVGPAASVDSEIAVFDSTTGKLLKRASASGVLKAAAGVLSAAVAGTDYARPFVLVATLAGDQATAANTTPVTLTGLVFSYEANAKYRIWAMGRVAPTAATTGCGFQFDLSSAVTAIDVQFVHQLASTGTLSGGHSIADDASVGVSSGMPGTSTYPVTLQGLLVTGANTGTAQLRFRSETTAVTTCKAGFTLVVERVA